MNFLNVDIPVKNVPELDKGFVPLGLFFKNYQKGAAKPLCIAVERSGGQIGTYETKIYGTPEMEQADAYYVDRLVKFLLWSWGGFKVSICGDDNVAAAIRAAYSEGGSRAFDKGFMEQVYETEFIVESLPYDKKPEAVQRAESIGRHLDGGRIGFDAGGIGPQGVRRAGRRARLQRGGRLVPQDQSPTPITTLKASWRRCPQPRPRFWKMAAVWTPSACPPRACTSTTSAMVASLFLKVGRDEFDKKVKNIYIRAAEQLSSQLGYHIPVVVANDGDVTALAGAMGLGENGIMGIAMGTSEAVGYVDTEGNICRLAQRAGLCSRGSASRTPWRTSGRGDIGCGVKYFSQDGVIKLAPRAGIELDGRLSPAEKLKEVQALMAADDARAKAVYESIGVYLGHTLGLYAMFYDIRHVQMMGRVMSGKGGDIIMETASRVMDEEYPDVAFRPEAPDEKTRRVGQSAAAASLPELK